MRTPMTAVAATVLLVSIGCSLHFEQRDMPFPLRRSYTQAFYERHGHSFRLGGALHYAHARQHDVLELTPLADAERVDDAFDRDALAWIASPPRIGPHTQQYAPHTAQAIWRVALAIDWTHGHHDATYDIMSDRDVPWSAKQVATDHAVRYYLDELAEARSPAPLEVTMRRAGVMMKPYFGVYRTHYPRSTQFFYAAHWWHPAVYEAMMVAGNDAEQDLAVGEVDRVMRAEVLRRRPTRMLLSREVMPRYSRLSPESANIFDNLHMLHGIIYAVLAYEGWSIDEKRAEIERVIEAMSEQPGDRELAHRFPIPHPNVDPRRYEAWMQGYEGEMNRIMEEMFVGMWPSMSPDGSATPPPEIMAVVRQKLRPGLEPGEHPGSLHDALMAAVPGMRMDRRGMQPGVTPRHMTEMARAWARSEAPRVAYVEAIDMRRDPPLASLGRSDVVAMGGAR